MSETRSDRPEMILYFAVGNSRVAAAKVSSFTSLISSQGSEGSSTSLYIIVARITADAAALGCLLFL